MTPTGRPRVILATNLAETTLTVPDVVSVVDTGLHKVARYDAARLIDSLEVERISADSAAQRAGRAGRTGPGRVVRLWDARDRLRPHREPEIARVDLAATALDVIAWGGDPRQLDWFERPPAHALDAALVLLQQLGATRPDGRLTPLGEQLRRLPLHPRLGRLLVDGRAAPEVSRACALLSERHVLPPRHGATSCDLWAAVEHEHELPPHVRRVARDLMQQAGGLVAAVTIDEPAFRRAVLAAYPDRVAERREPHGDRFLLASGTGARLSRDSGVHEARFVVAVDVSAGGPGREALIRIATAIDRDWLAATASEIRHELDVRRESVRATRIDSYGALAIAERPVRPDPAVAEALVADEYLRRGPTEADAQMLARLAFAGTPAPFEDLVRAAASGQTRLGDVDIGAHVAPEARRAVDRAAPESLQLPSGKRARLVYLDDGRVKTSIKLQHAFGLTESPRLGPRRVPVTFELLAPNGRPVQVTTDLASFWARGYPEVRKELRARYPKHAWP